MNLIMKDFVTAKERLKFSIVEQKIKSIFFKNYYRILRKIKSINQLEVE